MTKTLPRRTSFVEASIALDMRDTMSFDDVVIGLIGEELSLYVRLHQRKGLWMKEKNLRRA